MSTSKTPRHQKTSNTPRPESELDPAQGANSKSVLIPCTGLAGRAILQSVQATTPMLYFHETTRYEAMQDEWEDNQPEHTPCWQFEIPSLGVLDWTTDEAELNGWVQSAIAAGQYVKKTVVAPF